MGASWSGIVTPTNEPDHHHHHALMSSSYKISSSSAAAVHHHNAITAASFFRTGGFNHHAHKLPQHHRDHQASLIGSVNLNTASSVASAAAAATVADPVTRGSMFAQHLHLMNTLTLKKLISSGTLSRPKHHHKTTAATAVTVANGKTMANLSDKENHNHQNQNQQQLHGSGQLLPAAPATTTGLLANNSNGKTAVTAHEAAMAVNSAYNAQLPRTMIVDVIEDNGKGLYHAHKYGKSRASIRPSDGLVA